MPLDPLFMRYPAPILDRLRRIADLTGRSLQEIVRSYTAEGLVSEERRLGLRHDAQETVEVAQ